MNYNLVIKITPDKLKSHILKYNDFSDEIASVNRAYSDKILALNADGWQDAVYAEVYRKMFSMQTETNQFIHALEAINEFMVKTYCDMFSKYAKVDCVRPIVEMHYVDTIPGDTITPEDVFSMSIATMDGFVTSTKEYFRTIADMIGEFENDHSIFSEYFQTPLYDQLTENLRLPLENMADILSFLDALADDVEERKNYILTHGE